MPETIIGFLDMWGGSRAGAGRPAGKETPRVGERRKATREVVAKAVERFETDHPNAFPGDAVALLQCVYRNPNIDLAVRIDAASKAARFERPQLAATMVRDTTPAAMGVILLPVKEA
jgi:hypothetical protein